MSRLRKHLDAEKAIHQSARFPGDLASELLPLRVMEYENPRHRVWPWWKIAGSAAAIAALIALIIGVVIPTIRRSGIADRPTIARTMPEEQLPIALSMPDELDSIIPEHQSISFPTMPSISDLSNMEEATQTPEESV